MLVLSRQKNQKVKFPGLGITVEILEVRGSRVRVGVEAPIEVRVLRDELPDCGDNDPVAESATRTPHVALLPPSQRHEVRNALHELSLMLHVYRKRNDAQPDGSDHETIDSKQMFDAIVTRIENLGNNAAFRTSDSAPALPIETRSDSSGVALLVDDDRNERELLAGFLRLCGYEVATASDGIEALEWLDENEPPRFALLDMAMPRCDGSELLKRMRDNPAWRSIDVFVVSGSGPEEYGLATDQIDGRWLSKPLDPRRLVERMSGAAAHRE